MQGKWSIAGLLLVLSVLVLSGCARSTSQEPVAASTPTPVADVEESTAPVQARDAALIYLGEHYGEQAPAPDLAWTGGNTTPEGWVGGTTYEFAAREWAVTVSYPVVAPEAVVYQVVADNQVTGFHWEGKIDAAGTVTELTGPSPAEAPDPVFARDAALAYLGEGRGAEETEQSPAPDLIWTEKDATAEGLVGGSGFQYAAGDWVVTVSYPLVSPAATIYQVTVVNEATGFQWQGEVNAAGQVSAAKREDAVEATAQQATEVFVPVHELPVVGWYGRVVSLPAGSQFDDYLVVWPEGTAEVGLTGADAAIEAKIVGLRDKEPPSGNAHFWGTLACPMIDYGGCELVVSRVRPDAPGPFFEPDRVEGWEGTLHSGPAGPRSGGDDYLLLAGRYGIQYGIWGSDDALESQLESLRDTGTVVRVWGDLVAGIPDWSGTQIRVTRLGVHGATELPVGSVNDVEGWVGAIARMPWGSQVRGYFERADGERFGITAMSADESVARQIQEYRWTGAQVQVWGQWVANVPDAYGRQIRVERIEALSGPSNESRNLALFASASASSELRADRGGTYHAWSAINGALDSPWSEGVDGAGIGESIELTFPGTIQVWAIGLDVGYDRDAGLFAANNRMKRATFIFSNGEQVTLDFADSRGMQTVSLARAPGPPITTTYVRMMIDEVYPGTTYDDTCVGEIEVWGKVQ